MADNIPMEMEQLRHVDSSAVPHTFPEVVIGGCSVLKQVAGEFVPLQLVFLSWNRSFPLINSHFLYDLFLGEFHIKDPFAMFTNPSLIPSGRKIVVKEDFDVDRERMATGGGGGGGGGGGRRNRSVSPRRHGGGGQGGGGSGMMGFGNTYGLSARFLESLGIDSELHTRVFVANLDYAVSSLCFSLWDFSFRFYVVLVSACSGMALFYFGPVPTR